MGKRRPKPFGKAYKPVDFTVQLDRNGFPKYKADYARRGFLLKMLGASDVEIAFVFGVSLADIARWAWDHKRFFDAITPTEKEREEYLLKRQKIRDKRNKQRRCFYLKNPSARVRNAIGARIYAALKGRSDGKLFQRLGYDLKDLMAHLESNFKAGMNWENYGKWHVDHVKPCNLFNQTNPLEFKACWALENLQPLWASENVKKNGKYVCA